MEHARRDDGEWLSLSQHLPSFDSTIARSADSHNAPEMLRLREQIRSLRFYDHFRTDADAPTRRPQIALKCSSCRLPRGRSPRLKATSPVTRLRLTKNSAKPAC